ncbi:hypothetical protein [Enterobacter asburiae]|uniref:hypothetical protein n=1 Tax=Enterobacter asburiae TaxID=61645 RepID=UPI00192BAD02|nr:hypothetical protein [Enterobacter asburiae]MBL5926055.1 hypothetical protein [Enterobacter asburiae]MBL5956840.1 hypothetical protein [Enterobacter asburiae]
MKDTSKIRDLQVPISIEGHPLQSQVEYLLISEIEDALNEFIDSGLESPAITKFNNSDPLCSPIFLLEYYLNNISEKFDANQSRSALLVAKAIIKVAKFSAGLVFKNIKAENQKNKIFQQVSSMISSAVAQNNIDIITLQVEGVYSVYLDFMSSLIDYMEIPDSQKNSRQSSELLQQVYNKFDDVTSAVLHSQPTVLSLEDGSGIPFYCQLNIALVMSHFAMLSSKDILTMSDDYFSRNRRVIGEYIDQINANVHSKTIGYLSSKFQNKYNNSFKFLRNLYLSGYSAYQSAIRKIHSLDYPCEFQWRNSVEIYGTSYSEPNDSIYDVVQKFGRDMNTRMSMLTRILSYSHIDAVIRIIQSYVTSNNTFIEYRYEGCKGVTGDSHDRTLQLECCDSGSDYYHPSKIVPVVRYISDAPFGALHSMVLKTPTGTALSAGSGAWENKEYLNIPGYYFTAANLANAKNGSGECRVDSGKWLKESGPIFRSLDGYIPTLVEIDSNIKKLKRYRSYEMDFNNGLIRKEAISSQADILIGKNCFVCEKDREFEFQIRADGLFVSDKSYKEDYELLVTFASEYDDVRMSFEFFALPETSYSLSGGGSYMMANTERQLSIKPNFNDTLPLLNYPSLSRRIPFKTYTTGTFDNYTSPLPVYNCNKLGLVISFNQSVLISSIRLIVLGATLN